FATATNLQGPGGLAPESESITADGAGEYRGKHPVLAGVGEMPGPWGRRRVALEQADVDGEAKQLGARLEAELVTQTLAVGLDRLHAHAQLVGGCAVRVPLSQQQEHLGLTRTQRLGLHVGW